MDKETETEILGTFKLVKNTFESIYKKLEDQVKVNNHLLKRIETLEEQQLRLLEILSGK